MVTKPRMVAGVVAIAITMLCCQVASAQSRSRGRSRSGKAPGALGHSLSTQTLQFLSYTGDIEGQVEFPVAGRIKIADNTSPLARDRVYYIFNHFHNAIDTTVIDLISGTPTTRSTSLDRHTVGMEKTFFDKQFSVELRMPIFNHFSDLDINTDFSRGNYTVGNLSVINKAMIFNTGENALSTGFAITAPTGDDVSYAIDGELLRINNDAVHMTPFVGFLRTPTDRFFMQSFAEIDIPLSGNRAEFALTGAEQTLGVLNPQTVFCGDISLGYWLIQPDDWNAFTRSGLGLASILEFSYLTALEDADTFSGATSTTNTAYGFGNVRNRFDVVVTTIGLHAEIAGRTTIRTGAVLPLTDGDNRFFDSELLLQLNYRF